jgi:hypothetical protein
MVWRIKEKKPLVFNKWRSVDLLFYWNIWEIENYPYSNHSLEKAGDLVSVLSGTSYIPPVKRKIKF